MTNMGRADRLGRIVIALVLAYLALGTDALAPVGTWIALAVAAVFALTSLVGTCPLYRIVGFKTCRSC